MPGTIITEGDRAMRSDIARFHHNVDGSGIKIGIISDTFNAFGEARGDVLAGELPGRDNPNGYTSCLPSLIDFSTSSGVNPGTE